MPTLKQVVEAEIRCADLLAPGWELNPYRGTDHPYAGCLFYNPTKKLWANTVASTYPSEHREKKEGNEA